MKHDIVLAGVGGQGALSMGALVAVAAIHKMFSGRGERTVRVSLRALAAGREAGAGPPERQGRAAASRV